MDKYMSGLVALLLILGGTVIALMVSLYTAETVERKPMVPPFKPPTSKRCKQCQVHPQPKDMVLFFGPNWAIRDTCSECRAKNIIGVTNPLAKPEEKMKAYLALAPKLLGLAPAEIKEWYVPKAARKAARDKSYSYEYRKKYEIYVTDGKRYWQWRNFPHLMNDFITCDKFKEAHTSWEVLTLEGTMGEAFSHIAC